MLWAYRNICLWTDLPAQVFLTSSARMGCHLGFSLCGFVQHRVLSEMASTPSAQHMGFMDLLPTPTRCLPHSHPLANKAPSPSSSSAPAAGAAIKYGSLLVDLPHQPNAAIAVGCVLMPPIIYAAALLARGSGSSDSGSSSGGNGQ